MLRVENILCEYKEKLLGTDEKNPRISWQIKSDDFNVYQEAYRIQVSKEDSTFQNRIVWDSGKTMSQDCLHIEIKGEKLQPKTRYYVRVKVWAKDIESDWSESAYFETGLMDEGWQAEWITSEYKEHKKETKPVYYFIKDLIIKKPVKRARIYSSALGLYDIYIDDEKISDSYFRPGFTSYDNTLQYQTYEAEEALVEGEHKIVVMLADGWYRGVFTFLNMRNLWGKKTALIFQMNVEYEDGTTEIISSDESWQVSDKGNIYWSEFYLGEKYDANRYVKDEECTKAKRYRHKKDMLVAQTGEDVVKIDEVCAKKVIKTPKGETVIDFGQNLAGWVKLSFKNTRQGQEITISHAETLDEDGNFYTRNLRKAKAQIVYIAKGDKEETYEPHFTYMGFRYIRIEGYADVDLDTASAQVICSDMKKTMEFDCSNPDINKLVENIMWSQRANFIEIPTDCPQRDERMGYTGDAQIFSGTANFNMRTAKFFTKWLNDLKSDQRDDGAVDMTIPREIKLPFIKMTSSGWGDAATIVPWSIYEHFGDRRVLENHFVSMKRWVDFSAKKASRLTKKEKRMDKELRKHAKYICSRGYHLGDWLAPGEEKKQWVAKKKWVATAYFAHSADITAKTAGILGKEEDEKKYSELFEKISDAFIAMFVNEDGSIDEGFQSAYALALKFGLIPKNLRMKTAEFLAADVANHENHLTTGFLGTPALCFALSENAQEETAIRLLLQDTCPSWLYPVKMGATSVWERWDSLLPDGTINETLQGSDNMVSFNHYSYGAIGEWIYKNIGGISSGDEPGFKKFMFAPLLPDEISHANITFESMYGRIEAGWEKKKNRTLAHLFVPPNTSAKVKLPVCEGMQIMCNGKPVEENPNITNIKNDNGEVLFEMYSGKYNFNF